MSWFLAQSNSAREVQPLIFKFVTWLSQQSNFSKIGQSLIDNEYNCPSSIEPQETDCNFVQFSISKNFNWVVQPSWEILLSFCNPLLLLIFKDSNCLGNDKEANWGQLVISRFWMGLSPHNKNFKFGQEFTSKEASWLLSHTRSSNIAFSGKPNFVIWLSSQYKDFRSLWFFKSKVVILLLEHHKYSKPKFRERSNSANWLNRQSKDIKYLLWLTSNFCKPNCESKFKGQQDKSRSSGK